MTDADPQPRNATSDFVVAEFNALRAEMGERAGRQMALIALNLTTTTAFWGLALSGRVSVRILLALGLLSPSLGRIWADHHFWINRSASYIRDRLQRVAAQVAGDERVFGWEHWLDEERAKHPIGERRGALHFRLTIAAFFLLIPALSIAVALVSLAEHTHAHRPPWWWWLFAACSILSVALRVRPMWRDIGPSPSPPSGEREA
jgi:hypothetical protein